jgi:hypothetical protein
MQQNKYQTAAKLNLLYFMQLISDLLDEIVFFYESAARSAVDSVFRLSYGLSAVSSATDEPRGLNVKMNR